MGSGEIWIIGTEPPCPRCDYLTRMVKDIVARLNLSVPVRHLSYTSEEARRFAAADGLQTGTAKDVASKAGVHIDWHRVHLMVEGGSDEASVETPCCPTAGARWTPELDELLRPCQIKAREAGFLMTPALVVGGRCVHQGSVPDRGLVARWIDDSFGGRKDDDARTHLVEVLGPGCDKCAQLHRNVLQAVRRAGLEAHFAVRKREDIGYFREMGVAITPGLVIDGRVISKGRLLSSDQIMALLRENAH